MLPSQDNENRLKTGKQGNSAEGERHQQDNIKIINDMRGSQVTDFSSRLDRVESTIAKLESMDDVVNQVSLELQDANKRFEAIENTLKATVGYNIRRTFECSSCMTKGVVAIKVTCAKCGKDTWWGWWPGTKPTF